MKKLGLLLLAIAGLVWAISATPALAARPAFGNLYYNDTVVRTIVPPAAMPQEGRDNLYVVANGVEGQLAITAVAPGHPDYHGGQWAFHSVSWNDPADAMLLTSEAAVMQAEADGLLTITRIPENDFKCPVQP